MMVTIYHNPDCGTSRNTLAMIRQSGEEPVVIEYLNTPPTRQKLVDLLKTMEMPARALLREKGTHGFNIVRESSGAIARRNDQYFLHIPSD